MQRLARICPNLPPRFRLYLCLLFCGIFELAVLGVGIHYQIYYAESAKKLEGLRESHLRSKKENSTYLELQIKEQESNTNWFNVRRTVCIVVFCVFPFLIMFIHSCKEILRHCPNPEDCLELCPVLRFLVRIYEGCYCSDEGSAGQISGDLSPTYDLATPESVVFRGTRNTEGGAERENSGGLPGIPSIFQ